MAGNVVVRDLGWKRIKTEVRELHGRGVKVGLRAGSGSTGGVPIVEYAAYQEFGTDTIPARPFMRHAVDTNEKQIAQVAKAAAQRVVSGRSNADGALDMLGLWFKSRIQDSIRTAAAWAAPLSPRTIRQKRSSRPLIDTASMLNAVDYEKERF